MAGLQRPFTVDVTELHQVVADIGACQAELRSLADEIAAQVHQLHSSWEGEAAVAQEVAQQVWQAGFRDMRDALGQMRAAACVAHDNYAAAVGANVRMWSELR
jgi:WXG100 family type VII secretion target